MMVRAIRIWMMLAREWERIRTKDWFQRLPESLFELEETRMQHLFRVGRCLLAGTLPESKPLILKQIKLDKTREIVELPLHSQLAHGLLRQILEPSLKRIQSPHAHSFIRGRSVETAFEHILGQLKGYRKKTKQKDRALYVLRADIKKCGESIPVHPRSALWPILSEILPDSTLFPNPVLIQLFTRALRPELEWKDAPGSFHLRYGVPTGSPLQPLILNLYLGILDRYFEEQLVDSPHAIYCRYGDDFFFAHPDPRRLQEITAGFLRNVSALELEVRADKLQTFRWSGSGFQGRQTVPFLGYEIHFNGTLRIHSKKQAVLQRHLNRIVRKTLAVLPDLPLEERLSAVARGLERAYGIRSGHPHPYMDKLMGLGNDRGQLLQLDHEVCLTLAETITGKRGPRAFRSMRKKTLFQNHGIPSLIAKRNR